MDIIKELHSRHITILIVLAAVVNYDCALLQLILVLFYRPTFVPTLAEIFCILVCKLFANNNIVNTRRNSTMRPMQVCQ